MLSLRAGVVAVGAWLLALQAGATPYRPGPDFVVLTVERSAARVEIDSLRTRSGTDAAAAVTLARSFIDEGKRRAQPRVLGYAETVLQPWLAQEPAALPVLMAWADILQYRHEFGRAQAVLEQVIGRDPRDAEALLKHATLAMARGAWPVARRDCARIGALQATLEATVCLAEVRGATGDLRHAYRVLVPIAANPRWSGSLGAWVFGTAAEFADRLGDTQGAGRWYEAAVQTDPGSLYARTALGDYWLRAGRFSDVLDLLADAPRSDGVLLDVALARRGLGDPAAAEPIAILTPRRAEARARGDETHLRERARFELEWLRTPAAALASAQKNWQVQRELADLRLLASAAAAARDQAALDEVAAWMKALGFEDREVAARLAARAPT
jgi:hypothetical protein